MIYKRKVEGFGPHRKLFIAYLAKRIAYNRYGWEGIINFMRKETFFKWYKVGIKIHRNNVLYRQNFTSYTIENILLCHSFYNAQSDIGKSLSLLCGSLEPWATVTGSKMWKNNTAFVRCEFLKFHIEASIYGKDSHIILRPVRKPSYLIQHQNREK